MLEKNSSFLLRGHYFLYLILTESYPSFSKNVISNSVISWQAYRTQVVKTENNAQKLPERFHNNFEKVEITTFLTLKIVKNYP